MFHASLIVFGSTLIPRGEIECAAGYSQNRSRLPKIRDFLRKAVVALDLLDKNNPLLDQCGAYTASLLQLTEAWSQKGRASSEARSRAMSTSNYATANGSQMRRPYPPSRQNTQPQMPSVNPGPTEPTVAADHSQNNIVSQEPAVSEPPQMVRTSDSGHAANSLSILPAEMTVAPQQLIALQTQSFDAPLANLPTLSFDPGIDDLLELGPFFNDDLQRWLPSGDFMNSMDLGYDFGGTL